MFVRGRLPCMIICRTRRRDHSAGREQQQCVTAEYSPNEAREGARPLHVFVSAPILSGRTIIGIISITR